MLNDHLKKNKINSRVWLLDVGYPFFLATLLLVAITYLFYSGQKHRKLSAQMEERLIRFSLPLASPRIKNNPQQVGVISVSRNLEPMNYIQVMESLIERGVRYLIVQWIPLGPEREDALYPKLIALSQKASQKQSQIHFAVHPSLIKNIPQTAAKQLSILEADLCQDEVQLICLRNPDWSHWLIETLFRDFSENEELRLRLGLKTPRINNPYFVSDNLPSLFPSYLLNLHQIQELKETPKIVFLGLKSDPNPDNHIAKEYLHTQTAFHLKFAQTDTSSIPLHMFWAQITEMFIDNAFIAIAPLWASVSLALVFAMAIVFILLRFNSQTALIFLVMGLGLSPLFNAILMRYAHWYIPLFDSFYVSLSVFFIFAFIRLSYESFQNWRLIFREESQADLSDTKGNFLSLLSHNLNTPIAKMQGLIDILIQSDQDKSNAIAIDLGEAQRLLALVQLNVRFVLMANMLEERQRNEEICRIPMLIKELENSALPSLRRLGINLTLDTDLEDENLHLPFSIDKRAWGLTVLAFLILSLPESIFEAKKETHPELKPLKIKLDLALKEDDQNHVLICTQTFLDTSQLVCIAKKSSFLNEIATQLINALFKNYPGIRHNQWFQITLPLKE